jgi:WD40 repeat protein
VQDVFVSYSRRDTEFVRRLVEGLQARGKEVWLDTEGIRDGEVFPDAIRSAVEGSNAFVFVISPESVASPFCDQEVDHALEHHKQIVPLVYRPVADGELPEPIRVRNWIPFETEDGFDAGVRRLLEALDTDLEWTEQHTRWLLKAREWEREGRDRSFLLRGAELDTAERWLTGEAGKDPEPTPLQREYVYASRAAATRRMRLLVGAMGVALAVAVALGIVALTQRNAAQDNQRRAEAESAVAKSRELAALSESQRAFDPELAILLGAEAVRTQPTTQAMVALRGALDASALRRTLRGHRDLVSGVSFSPDGRLVASTSSAIDSTARVWDVRSGRLVRRIPLPDQANHVRFAADGGMMVALDTGGTMIFDPRTGRRRGQIDPLGHVSHLDGSRDGSLLVTAGPEEVALRKYPGGGVVRRFRVEGLGIRPGLSSDNRVLAAGTDTGLYVWDAKTGRTLARVPGGETHAAVSPDGKLVAFGGESQRIQLLSPATGRVTRTLARFPSAHVISPQFSRDGRRLAAGTDDGAARIWDVRSGKLLDRFEGHTCCVADVSFNPDGSLLATSSKDKTVKLWATGGNALAQARVGRGPISGVAFAGDSVVATSGRGSAAVWNPGTRPRELPGVTGVRDLSVSVDGSAAALATAAGEARLFDPATGSVLRTFDPSGDATAVALDGRGRLLAVGTSAGVPVYATASGRQSGPSVGGASTDVAFAAGRRRLATVTNGIEEGLAMVLDGATDVPTARFNQPNRIITLAFSPNGSLLAGATEADTTVKLWNVAREREARQLFGHTDEVTSIAFSPDGALIATASEDRTVRVWHAATGDELRVIQHGTPVAAVGFSHDGRRLVSGDSRGLVRVWDACSGCRRPGELLRIARERVTRGLRPAERREFLRTAP